MLDEVSQPRDDRERRIQIADREFEQAVGRDSRRRDP
jgi:hypothetical protein